MHRMRLLWVISASAVLLFGALVISPAAQASLRSKPPATGHRAVVIAKRQLGIPYVWGGASRKGFDSSGLTMYVYAKLGVPLPHSATGQAKLGRRVRLGHLRPGDLVFWGSHRYYYHVAIYVGHHRVIDAPHTGAVVSYKKLRGAATARRLLPKS